MDIAFPWRGNLLENVVAISGEGCEGELHPSTASRISSIMLGLVSVGVLVCMSSLWLVVVIAIGIGIAYLIHRVRIAFARREHASEFEGDLVPYLLSVAASTRAGQDPLTAALQISNRENYCSALRAELLSIAELLAGGATEAEAFGSFGNSVDNEDAVLFGSAYLISRREGGGLAAFCKRLARVVRRRQAFRRKARAAVAMQRLSAMGIAGCCVLMLLFQWVTNGDGMSYAFGTGVGKVLLAAGCVLVISGICWLFFLTNKREW